MLLIAKIAEEGNGKPPMMSLSSARQIGKRAFYDCSKAVNVLGMPQTPFRTTIEKAVAWFRENGYVQAKAPRS